MKDLIVRVATGSSDVQMRVFAGSRAQMEDLSNNWNFPNASAWAGPYRSDPHDLINTPFGIRGVRRISLSRAFHVEGTWRTPFLAYTQNLVVHEYGHALGLVGHTTNPNHIMYANPVSGHRGQTSLAQGEIDFLRQIYNTYRGGLAPQVRRPILNGTNTTISYRGHVATIGWQGWVQNGAMAGTTGRGLRMEAMTIRLLNQQVSGGVEIRANVQGLDWQPWQGSNVDIGTTGQSRRLLQVAIRLTGSMGRRYHIEYRVHVANVGWMPWVRDSAIAGIENVNNQIEAIEVRLVRRPNT